MGLAMEEIRRIRDTNSERHTRMTYEEVSAELQEASKRFLSGLKHPVKVISGDYTKERHELLKDDSWEDILEGVKEMDGKRRAEHGEK
jgi:hypothetical protein